MPLQVGAALAVHAAYCVKDCFTTVTRWAESSAADILHTVQQHASILLQVASDHQVIVFLLYPFGAPMHQVITVIIVPYFMMQPHGLQCKLLLSR